MTAIRNLGLDPERETSGVMEQSPSKKTELKSEIGADVKHN